MLTGIPIIDLVLTVGVPLFLALYSIFAAYHAARGFVLTYFRFEPRWIKDVSQEIVPLPPGGEEIEGQLWMLGFEPIGTTQIKMFGHPPAYGWFYATQEGSIQAEVAQLGLKDKPVMTGFLTRFPDNALIITRYPVGENITTPNYQSHFAEDSLEAAYNFHVKQVEAWKAKHGTPVTVRTLDEMGKTDHLFRKCYRRRDYRRLLIIQAIQFVVHLAVAVTSLITVLSQNDFRAVVAFFAVLAVDMVASAQIADQINKPRGAVDR